MKNKLLFVFITLLIIAFTGYLLRVAFIGDPLEDRAQVKDLRLSQEGLDVVANWNSVDCDWYEVRYLIDGRLTIIPVVKDNTYTIKSVYPDERCKVTVTAHFKNRLPSRSAKAELTAEKLRQNIFVADTSYFGFAGNDFNLRAEANGDLHYRSSDRSIASVDSTGRVKLKESGEAVITIDADGNGLFDRAEKQVDVTIYPTVLDKIEGATAVNISPTRSIIKWQENDYAAAYTVLRKNPATEQYDKLAEKPAGENFLEVTRDNYDYEIKGIAEVNGEKVDGKVSDPVKVRGTSESSKSYSGFKIIRKLDESSMDIVARHDGKRRVKIPQGLAKVGDEYVVITDMKNAKDDQGDIISFNREDGSVISTAKSSGIGHGNGSAYNPNTGRLYVLSTKKGKTQQWCCVFDGETKEYIEKIAMPVACTAMAYDISTDKFYLAKKNKIYICSSNFKIEKTITKTAPFYRTQDMGAYNGVALVCTWPKKYESYLDLYRVSDGAYLGSYDLSFGEIESCVVDDGYLVILMNGKYNKDKICRTKERIAIP